MMQNPWKTLSSELKYDNPWIAVHEHDVIHPGGKPGIYGTVHFKNLAIGVIPVDAEGYTYLVGQFRYPLGTYSWEIPEGGGKLDVDPLETAKRELREETGLSAGSWERLLEMDLSNSVSDERAIVYLARDLTMGTPCPDDDEVLTVKRLLLTEAIDWVLEGRIRDSLSVAGLLRMGIRSAS